MPISTQLVKFHCDDADENENGQTQFVLLNTNWHITSSSLNSLEETDNDWFVGGDSKKAIRTNGVELLPFRISDDGKFYVAKKLDREQQDFYDLIVVCYDNASKQARLNTSLNLIIRLSDINDNCPRNLNQSELLGQPAGLPLSKQRFIILLKDSLGADNSSDIFTSFYSDADIGRNAELKFELLSHESVFKLDVAEPSSNALVSSFSSQIYVLKIQFRKPANRTSIRLGKYAIRIKVSDNGNPSCIKNDLFVLYLGDNHTRTQSELVDKLNKLYKYRNENLNGFDTVLNFVNDDDGMGLDRTNRLDVDYDASKNTSNPLVSGRLNESKSIFSNGLSMLKSYAFSSLSRNDYLVVLCLIITVTIIVVLLSFIGFLFLCRGERKTSKKAKTIKVKNYREIDLTSSTSNSNSGAGSISSGINANENEEASCEMNNLLEHVETNPNRLSSSFKSTDQSHSADSVVSNLTFARDSTTLSCNSSNSSHNEDRANPYHSISAKPINDSQNSFKYQTARNTTFLQPSHQPKYSHTLRPKLYDEYNSSNQNRRVSQSNLVKVIFFIV
jgi:hypothetical protein